MGRRLTLKTEPSEKLKELQAAYHAILNKPPEQHSNEVDAIFGFCGRLSEISQAVGRINSEVRKLNRSASAKRSYAIRKRLGLIKTTAQKREEAKQKRLDEQEWREPESCYCHMGHPPCSWCLDPRNDPDYVEEEN